MSNSPTVLLIDAHKEERDYYCDRLTKYTDFRVLYTDTGQNGLLICQRLPIVDCVVLELDLPDMSAFEVLLKLVPRVEHPDIPIVVLTGVANVFLLEAARRNGAHSALYKPMTSGDLLQHTIRKAMAAVPVDRKRLYS